MLHVTLSANCLSTFLYRSDNALTDRVTSTAHLRMDEQHADPLLDPHFHRSSFFSLQPFWLASPPTGAILIPGPSLSLFSFHQLYAPAALPVEGERKKVRIGGNSIPRRKAASVWVGCAHSRQLSFFLHCSLLLRLAFSFVFISPASRTYTYASLGCEGVERKELTW